MPFIRWIEEVEATGELAEVERHAVDLRTGQLFAQPGERGIDLRLAAAVDDHLHAAGRELTRSLTPDTVGGTGDERDSIGHAPTLRR